MTVLWTPVLIMAEGGIVERFDVSISSAVNTAWAGSSGRTAVADA
jgi:hypothetical protein